MSKDTFKILTDRDHILERPGMYIGSVTKENHSRFVSGVYREISYVPGLIKITNEVIDNCIDEAIRTNFKFANVIEVNINENEISVSDNGRGIPQVQAIDTNGESILQPVAAWTRAKAGTNFTDDRVGIGANGVGSFCTNVMSHSFVGETCDGKNTVTVRCSLNAERVFVNQTKGGTRGTRVTFIPDFNRFGVFSVSPEDVEMIRDRIENLSVSFPEITFKFNKKKVGINLKKAAEMYGAPVVFERDNVALFIGGCDDFKQNSFVNGVQTSNGGVHVDYFMNAICDALVPVIKRKHKVVVTKTALKQGMMLGLYIRNFTNPKFDSQTKERLTNSQAEISPFLKDIPYDTLAKKIADEESIVSPILEALIAKKMAEEARDLKKKQKEASRRNVEGHIKANYPKNATLFLTEGKSAMNFFLKVRSFDTQGGYALRGKFLNTWGETPSKILKTKEASDLVGILGLTLGDPDISSMTYKDIAIMTDADVDGKGSIYPLLLAFFYRWPELFKQGKVKFCKTPVIIATKGKSVKWFYSLEEFEQDTNCSGYAIRYIKGLGSLTEKEYRQVINEPKFDVVEIDDPSYFELLFGNDSDKRKLWMSNDDWKV